MPLVKAPPGAKQLSTTLVAKELIKFLIAAVGVLNFTAVYQLDNGNAEEDWMRSSRAIFLESHESNSGSIKSTTSFYWPSIDDGGLLQKIHKVQNPSNCSSPAVKFLVWQAMQKHKMDTRGLTAWGHAGASHMLHALTDGDEYTKTKVSRVLITDDKLWPMAKGCKHGPETRECYFEELTTCKLTDVNGKEDTSNIAILDKNSDFYDTDLRTVFLSETDPWFRPTSKLYSWTNLPGNDDDNSQMQMYAALLAYYFRPKPWLRSEIDLRIRASIPKDLNPSKTIGVPIRRSDKCKGHSIEGSAVGEFDCPPLSKYLEGIQNFLEFDPSIQNVIVTSEDASASADFIDLLRKELPQLRVITNKGDIQQGTGSGSKLEAYVAGSDNANVVASALTSLHLHLRAKYLVITTASTWTSTIAVMARSYGLASEIFVIDIGRLYNNNYSLFARTGCGASKRKPFWEKQ